MLLNLLPFISLKLGVNDYLIVGRTQLDIPFDRSVGILPSEADHFVFEDSNSNIYTEFPHIFSAGTKLYITPTQAEKSILTMNAAPLFGKCNKTEFVLDGIMKTNEAYGYYEEPICYVFMNPKFKNITLQVTSLEKPHYLYYATSEIPYFQTYERQMNGSAVTLMIEEKVRNSTLQMTAIDNSVFNLGDFEVSFTNQYEFHLAPNSVFVAHTIEGYTFESDIEPVVKGVYYSKNLSYKIVAKKQGNNTIVGSISLINPYMPCTQLNVEIVREETSTIFGNSDSDYSLVEGETFCHIFTSPIPRRYKFVANGYSENNFFSNINSTDHFYFSRNEGYPYVNKSAAFYLSVDEDNSYLKSGIETTDIVTPYAKRTDWRDGQIINIFGNITRNPKPEKPFKIEDGKKNINFFSGTYQILIPANGTQIKFQENTLVVFHNAHSFNATLSGTKVLAYTGYYVFNFTNEVDYFKIRPRNNQDLIANISVYLYDPTFDEASATSDVVVISPHHSNYFQISSYDSLGGYDTNLTSTNRQIIKINVFASCGFIRYGRYPSSEINESLYVYSERTTSTTFERAYFVPLADQEPETEEIYGLFRGPLSYTDLIYSLTKGKDLPKVYIYGSRYTPSDNDYNYPESHSSVGLILGITFSVIIVIVAAVVVVIFFLKRKKDQPSYEFITDNDENQAQEPITVKYDGGDQKVEEPQKVENPSLETSLIPPTTAVYVVVQPGAQAPQPVPNPYI